MYQLFSKVAGTKYSLYPQDFPTAETAKIAAAKEALEKLCAKEKEIIYEVCMDPDSELQMKVFDCLKNSSNGIIAKNMPDIFR